ncbi:MAG: polysaccharide biosynthesis/export family protein [Bacteroidales bacterium]|nr:polysaccharide biosynthesis/export family protein [Bacteroidales bacterium]
MSHKITIVGIIIIILSLFSLNSCTRYKDIVYLNHADTTGATGFYPYQVPEYKIQKRDVLYIRVITLNKETNDLINATPSYSGNLFNTEASFYLYGYNVNDSGKIELPILGEVEVVGKTLEQAKEEIKKSASVFIKDATVIVKLISFKYSVLGEVNTPGIYTNFNNQLTLLEAISRAGDITSFGDRKKILVLRPTTSGTKTFRFDLTKIDILTSEGFFLLPNDIVYVEPLNSKNFRNNIPVYSLLLSSITTFLLILN